MTILIKLHSLSEIKAVTMETNLYCKDKYYGSHFVYDISPLIYLGAMAEMSFKEKFQDIVYRKTTLTTTPVTLSLPPISLLMLFLILKNENRQIAIRHMCRHATGDVDAVAGRILSPQMCS